MAAIVWSDLTTMPGAPAAWASVNVLWQTTFLAIANSYISVGIFDGEDGPVTKLARCLYLAHVLALELQAGAASALGAAGPVTSNSADKLSQSYAAPSGGGMDADALGQTSYGRALLTLAWSRTRAVVLR